MKQVFKAHQLCEQDGPLGGPVIDSYAAEMRGEATRSRRARCKSVWPFAATVAVSQKSGSGSERNRAEPCGPGIQSTAVGVAPDLGVTTALDRCGPRSR
jgi:hypothetical protein